MPRLRNPRRQVLDAAAPLLVARGFHGFSYQHLADALGVKTAAVHYHFPSKADLGVALVEDIGLQFCAWAQAQAEDSAADQLVAFFNLHAGLLAEGVTSPASVLSAELRGLPIPMQVAIRQLLLDIRSWTAQVIARGRSDGEMAFQGDPTAMATVVNGAVHGALQLGIAEGPDQYHAAIGCLRSNLGLADSPVNARPIKTPLPND